MGISIFACANATVTFGNANQTTKNDLLAQYLVSKDLDPILLRKHPPLCQKKTLLSRIQQYHYKTRLLTQN